MLLLQRHSGQHARTWFAHGMSNKMMIVHPVENCTSSIWQNLGNKIKKMFRASRMSAVSEVRMYPSGLQEQGVLDTLDENASLLCLLEQGLQHIQQERYSEGLALLARIRDQLPAQHSALAEALDNFTQGYTVYWQTQQKLHHAIRCFAEEDTVQQTRLSRIKALVSVLKEDMQHLRSALPMPKVQPYSSMNDQQDRILQFPSSRADPVEVNGLPALHFTCFGCFEVKRLGEALTLCSNRNGQAMLRYLAVQPDHSATMDVLMETFWPDDEPEVAHHKLQVAASALRRSLNDGYSQDRGGGYLLGKRHTYQINPTIACRSDLDDFLEFYQAGRHTNGNSRINLYEQACHLYKGPLLVDDLYADWSSLRREQLSLIYLTMCNALVEYSLETRRYENALAWATALLRENHCDEAARRYLMRIYAALGRRNEALLQYQRCRQTLFEEFGVEPMPETVKLFHTLLNGEEAHEE